MDLLFFYLELQFALFGIETLICFHLQTLASRTTNTKTTVTTVKSTTKKPETLTRLSGGNTKSTAKTAVKPQQNGISVVEEITVVTTMNLAKNDNESLLVKDNSPLDNNIIIDNILQQSNNAD